MPTFAAPVFFKTDASKGQPASTSALLQPATFVVSTDLGRPALTLFDIGALARGPLGARGGLDIGARHAGGSGRSNERRVFTGIVRAWHRFDRLIVAGDTEYEANGDFAEQKGILGVEATVTHGPRGLGRPWSPTVRLRWRPWLGIGLGSVLATEADPFDPESGAFWRGHARLEVHYAVGAIEALSGDTRAPRAELDLEATGWLLFDDSRGEGLVKAALGIPLAHGFSVSASTGLGRQPPEFELERRIGLGIGFRY
jgi:hypothetical protein